MLNAKGSLEQRRAALIRLTAVYDRLSAAERNSASGTRMAGIIKGITDQVQALEVATGRSQRNVGNYGDGVSAFFSSIKSNILSTIGPIALITAAWSAAKAAFSHNVEISDSFVDVQRTAKLSGDQVDELGEKLKKINTRTSLEGLLDIGFIGGRLGVAKEDLVGFITTVDQLSVVLKKEFPGGADAVATALGKIISVYKITQKEGITLEQALNNTGSTFLELAHNGQVTVQYLQDFSLRTAGVAQIAKISLPTMLAYGAVLSQAGITAQVAGSSVTRLISSLSTKRDKYFAIAQLADSTLTIEKFTNLINTDTKSALELFFRGLKAGNPTQTEFGDRLKTLALTTGAAKNAVIALAENQDLLFEKTRIANKANEDGTSVAHNFELANNSLAASFEKIGNAIANSFTDSAFARKLAELLNSLTDNRSEAEKLAAEFANNKNKAIELDSTLKPLVKRYDELKKSGKLNSDQQFELRDITAKIGDLLPGVTTKFDDYNRSLEINRGKVQELTKAQREFLELQNRGALKKANEQFESAENLLPNARKVKEEYKSAPKGFLGNLNNAVAKAGYYFGFEGIREQQAEIFKDNVTNLAKSQYDAALAIRSLGGELTKAQQKVIDMVEGNTKKIEKKKDVIITGDGTIADETETARTTEVIKADIKALQEADKKLAVTSDEFKNNIAKIKELRKELRIALNGGVDPDAVKAASREENVEQSLFKKRNTLQKEIDAMVAASKRKQLTADQEEIEAVTDKYRVLRDKAKEHYDEVNKKIPKSKRAGFGLTLSGLNDAETGEKADVKYSQAAKKQLESFDIQKKQFIEYEQFKDQFGADLAGKRFKKDIIDNKSYLNALKAEAAKIVAIPEIKRTGGQKDQLTELNRRIADEVNAQAAKYDTLLQQLQTYQSKEQSETENYAKRRDQITANPLNLSNSQLAEQFKKAAEDYKNNIANISMDALVNSDDWKNLFSDLDNVATDSIDKLSKSIAAKSKEVGSKLNPIDVAAVQEKLDQAKRVLIERNPFAELGKSISAVFSKGADGAKKSSQQIKTDWNNLAAATAGSFAFVNDAVQSTQFLKDALGDVGATALSSLTATAAVALSVTTAIKSAEKASVVLAVISAALVVVQSIANVLSSVFGANDKKIEKQIKGYQSDLDALERGFKKLERDVAGSVGEEYYSNSLKEVESLKQQQAILIKQRDAERSKKKPDSSKLSEFQDKIDEIPNKIADIQAAVTDMLVQTNFKDFSSNLSDAFTDAFANGEDALASFDRAFNQVIANSIKKGLELKLIQPEVDKFIKDYGAYLESNDRNPLGFDFEAYRAKLKQKGDEFTAALDPFKEFFEPADSSTGSALNKTIKGITSDQANALEGIERAKYDIQKQSLKLQVDNSFNQGKQLEIATFRLRQLEMIQVNTANTVERLDKTIGELTTANQTLKDGNASLATIASNTKQKSTVRDGGAVI